MDKRSEKVAFRRVQIVQDKLIDQEGLTFLFEVNNIRIFCGGEHRFRLYCILKVTKHVQDQIGFLPIPS